MGTTASRERQVLTEVPALTHHLVSVANEARSEEGMVSQVIQVLRDPPVAGAVMVVR